MSAPHLIGKLFRGRMARCVWTLSFTWTVLSLWSVANAGDTPNSSTTGAVGVCVTESASILRRAPGDKTWHTVAQKGAVNNGDLLVGLPGAQLDSQDGAVRLSLLADLDRSSPFPVLESAVVVRQTPGIDLEFTLDRGRVEIDNRKESGSAQVRMHVRDDAWDLVLTKPGASVGVELYGRWPRGVPFKNEPDPKHVPTANMVLVVLKGEVVLKHKHHEHTLTAPPGPAMIEWDSVAGLDETPEHLDKLPAWAMPGADDTPVARAKKIVIERFRQTLSNKGVDEALEQFLNSESPSDRRLAIILLGAFDDLPRLGKAMREAKYPGLWEDGILTLRHWIGRGPGQDQILYKGLIEVGKYKPVQAETLMELLHSFGDEELAQPETYQTLIDYLDHDLVGIRGLAYWHLYRLVPAGRAINYNPGASKEERRAAIEKWRALVPKGQVPARTKSESKG